MILALIVLTLKIFMLPKQLLLFSIIAYNLVALFRTFVFQQKTQKPLSTLRYRNFSIGAYFKEINNKPLLTIVLSKKRRARYSGLWNYSKVFKFLLILLLCNLDLLFFRFPLLLIPQ